MRSFSICIALVAVLVAASIAGAGQVDRNPTILSNEAVPNNWAGLRAPWDLLFFFDVELATGAPGNAGSEFDGVYYYSTRWASNLIHRFDKDGNMVEEFSIAGVEGLRDLAYDGRYMYGGNSGGTIFEMDFNTNTLVSTIVGGFSCRAIAYDHKLDVFYVSNWDDPIVIVDRSGAIVGSFNVGLSSTYGLAYDNSCFQKPMLYIFDQTLGGAVIYEWNLEDGSMTGVTYDVAADFPGTIAGGLWMADNHPWYPDTWVIGGLAQGPDNIFVYELCDKRQWTICMKDVNYTPELWINVVPGGVIHGQAILEGNPGFPAAITGYIDSGKVYFAIDYWQDLGLRFYEIDLDGRNGTTWGVYTKTGKFYDTRHDAHLDPCGAEGISTESGAPVN